MSNGNIENIDGAARELIIIRRGTGEDLTAAKGGAWKIAYADFVTAMMAFFLVMWLINSANEATKARVASYFNPIKMTDASPANRSLRSDDVRKPSRDNQKREPETTVSAQSATTQAETKPDSSDKQVEEAILANPFIALDQMSTEGSGNPSGRTVEVTTQRSGDPFDPQVWEALRNGTLQKNAASTARDVNVADVEPQTNEPIALQVKSPQTQKTELKVSETNIKELAAVQEKKPELASKIVAIETARQQQVVRDLKNQLQNIKHQFAGLAELNVDVRLIDEGVLIVLEDGQALSMFKVGSAVPNPAMVDFIAAIGALLQLQTGDVIVRGHTDARRFQTIKFDNWQLSTARAHMASYMLMRGGLSENRIRKIEGHGAAALLDRADPMAGINRRVEIILIPEL
jgi:chemotaxis protein MotB